MAMTLPASEQLKSSCTQYYTYDEESLFGVKVSVRDAYEIAEHTHANIQISIPIRDTSIEVQWQRLGGDYLHAVARHGDAMIIPSHQRHAVSWKSQAHFVNLHIGVALTTDDLTPFLASIARAGEMHVVTDPFLSSFGENVVSLVSRGVKFDGNLMRALRLIIVEHIVNTYAPDSRKTTFGDVDRNISDENFYPPADVSAVQNAGNSDGISSKPPAILSSGLAPWQLRKVIAIVESDLRRDHSIAELADLVDLSKGHFSRAFRASTGLSPRQWIIHARVKLAIRKLSHTSESLADVAQNCGFAEQSHFTRTFTQITGASPGAWRRANKL